MSGEKMILGLDLGTNSIGWAIIEYEAVKKGRLHIPQRLADTGARMFREGVEPKTNESRNAQRRDARAMRRLHQRRNRRRCDLKAVLEETGLLPTDKDGWAALMLEDPYRLRAAGLDGKLALFEIGRALYHIAQRRGFKSNRKTDGKDTEGTVKPAISALREKIGAAKCRTLGEYLYKKSLDDIASLLRGRYTHRDMYEEEFKLIWNVQRKYYPKKLTDELRQRAYESIFFQRPYDIRERWGKDLERLPRGANARRAPQLGLCEYEKGERRSPRGTWYAQRFCLLQDVNNLRIVDTALTGEERELDDGERKELTAALGRKKEMDFGRIRKLLGLADYMRFNLEEGGLKKLKGNATEWNLRQVFKKRYDGLSAELRDEIVQELLFVEDEKVLARRAGERWGLEDKAVERLLKTGLASGYLHLSEKALKKLLPYLEEGASYMEAVGRAGYERRDQRLVLVSDKLRIKDVPDLTNPLVRAALHQLRRVVNGIAREYGKPCEVRVEMVRDLKNPAKRRREIMKEQKENERRNEKARERLQNEFGMPRPSRDDIIKYNLWEECGHECPYTGLPIPREALFSQDWDVEHIIPYPRSLDNSYMNKTLCQARENRERKGNHTPWEAYGHDEERWEKILKRIRRLPRPKIWRFYIKELPDDFINRQLTDTAYIAKEARAFLEKLVGKGNVAVGKGRVTSDLRYMWGLNGILGGGGKKSRDDHRHHAVDAVVIALTSPEILKRMSKESVRVGGAPLKGFKEPWKGFRGEVERKIKGVLVSHRVQRKVSGALHEETNYGILKKKDKKGQLLYALRKPLDGLTSSEVERIADTRVRDIVKGHLKEHGVDLDKDNEKTEVWKKAMAKPVFLPNRNGPPVPIKRVRLHRPFTAMIDLGYRAVKPGSNHHIVIYEHTDGKKKGQWDGDVVSRFKAARRVSNKQPVIRRDPGEGKRFVMSLSINETVRIGNGEGAKYWRVQKINASTKQMTFRLHTAATIDKNEERLIMAPNPLNKSGAVKVTIDPLGRVNEAND